MSPVTHHIADYPASANRELQLHWIETLGSLLPHIGRTSTKRIYRDVSLSFATIAGAAECTWYGSNCVIAGIHPSVDQWYKVERIELLTGVARTAFAKLDSRGAELAELSRIVGNQAPLRILSPADRWLHYDAQPNRPSWFDTWEDRPRCVLCRRRVSTGHKRDNCHDQCVQFAEHVLIPQHREALRLALQQDSADADK